MKSQYETLVDSQKKIIDYWKKVGDDFNKTVSETLDVGPKDFLKSWEEKSKQFWKDAAEMGNLKKVFEDQPAVFSEFAKKQQELFEEWNTFYKNAFDQLNPAKASNPFTLNGKVNEFNPVQATKEWMEKGSSWIEKELINKTPFIQQGYYKEFRGVFEKMYKFWDPMLKMMEFDISNWDQIKHFLNLEDYKDLVGKFMGFNFVGNQDNFLGEIKEAFDKAYNWFDQHNTHDNHWAEQIEKFNAALEGDDSPFKYFYGITKFLNESMDASMNFSGQGKEIKALKHLKDIQYSFMTYLTKNFEMQQKVYESSVKALPETLEHFTNQYKEKNALPDYQEFFNHFINNLENCITDALKSKEYSVLQSAVSKAAVSTKTQMEKFIETAASDLPFLTNSFADEIALENKELRNKIRGLENRLYALEKALSDKSATKKVVPKVRPVTKKLGVTTPTAKLKQGTIPKKISKKGDLLLRIGKANGKRDNLKEIKGIGNKLEGILNKMGIFTFAQIAKMKNPEYQLLDSMLTAFKGRAKKDDWAGQAKVLNTKK